MKASFSEYGNDLFWSIFLDGATCRWSGYDDFYWWNSVAKTEQFQIKEHKGNKYKLNPTTCEVTKL